jgi:ATP-dependent RNA helicase HelY
VEAGRASSWQLRQARARRSWEFAVLSRAQPWPKCFYTTPIKALSNQKYADLISRYGTASVGLLTGDNSINGEAPVVVMTTEVLRNMLYAGSPTLAGLGYVVMDEVHYLSDRFRGGVWEEVIIHLPDSVTLVSLSATVSNAEEFGDWLVTVRGDTTVIVEEHRPVPLWQHLLVGRRLFDLFAERRTGTGETATASREVNPALVRLIRGEEQRATRPYDTRRRGRGRPPRAPRWQVPSRPDVIDILDSQGLLPAITFIFSRAGCEARSANACTPGCASTPRRAHRGSGVCRGTMRRDPGRGPWSSAIRVARRVGRGVAAHHARACCHLQGGRRRLFVRGLIKAVFAHGDTGARHQHAGAFCSPRAAGQVERGDARRRDCEGVHPAHRSCRPARHRVEGHAVVLWQPGIDPTAVAGLASTRTYPLRSSFRPSYNMAVNLVGQVGRATARELLETSFAQFQADRAVVGLARQVQRNEEALAGYREAASCDRGDFMEYAALRRELSDREPTLPDVAGRRRATVINLSNGCGPAM